MSDADPTLHLVATPIGNLGDITRRAADILEAVEVVACEDTRRTGRLLQHLGVRARRLIVANEHTEVEAARQILDELAQGFDVAVVTDAGLPGISDPGERLVREVAAAGYRVTVAPGPTSPASALAVSGLPTRRYVVEGFLPRKGAARQDVLISMAQDARTTVILESPQRIGATLGDLVDACGPDRPAVVVRELTKLHEEIARGTLAELRDRYSGPVKGEIVLVVGGAPRREPTDEEILEALQVELAAGATKRDAVAAVAQALGVGPNRAYELAIGGRVGGQMLTPTESPERS